MNLHGDFFYMISYGDKDTFRFAFKATNTSYAMSGAWVAWLGTGGLSQQNAKFCGEVMMQYAPIGPGELHDVAPFELDEDSNAKPSDRSRWPSPLFLHANSHKHHSDYNRYFRNGRSGPFETVMRYKDLAPGTEALVPTYPRYDKGCGWLAEGTKLTVETIWASELMDSKNMNRIYKETLLRHGIFRLHTPKSSGAAMYSFAPLAALQFCLFVFFCCVHLNAV
jgi:hypothetical protein